MLLEEETLSEEQKQHMLDNVFSFSLNYQPKYRSGQIKHSGNMWTMGAYQALENAEEEALDNWSYLRQIRKTLDEIWDVCDKYQIDSMETADTVANEIIDILNRRKED